MKERGGLAIAQDPEEAMHDGMPRSAIHTGLVDWVLPVHDMPARLMSFFGLEKALVLPQEHPTEALEAPDGEKEEQALQDVLEFVRSRTGRNFSLYKRGTMLRRIARRMQLCGVDNLAAYLTCLQTRSGEADALVQDLLISVTNFFRDVSSFDALEQQIPELMAGKESVRAWVAGCATGEEAYSVAMLLVEAAERMDAPPSLQVFATDLDEQAIKVARQALYPPTIVADVSDGRLRRFFRKEPRGYRVRRELRELILFATHDLLSSPPFSRVDLITCRNVLIYLGRQAQQDVFQTLRFALKPHGLLMLGTSETVDEGSGSFEIVDKRHRLYRQVPSPRSTALIPARLLATLDLHAGLQAEPMHRLSRPLAPLPSAQVKALVPGISWREVHLNLLEHLAPASVLLDDAYDLLHVSHAAASLLRFPTGEPTCSVLRALPQAAATPLAAALSQAAQTSSPVVLASVDLEQGAGPMRIRIVPLPQPSGSLFLVTFEPADTAPPTGPGQGFASDGDEDALARHLDHEMQQLKDQLRDTSEQYDASTEELRASNEELQSMYEEMRAQTEELETGKEELQSVNEELSTVNLELKENLEDLSRANSDIQNLMDATSIAIVFVDRELKVTRYTPSAVKLFNLIPTDVGRPLSDLAMQLEYPQLTQDARSVLETLAAVEREVGQAGGNWFLVRLRPYRTVEDRIAGVVFTFIDITARKRSDDARLWLASVVASTPDAVVSFTPDQTITSWNRGAERLFQVPAEDAIGQSMLLFAAGREQEQAQIAAQVKSGHSIENLETVRRRHDGQDVQVGLTAAPIQDSSGDVVAISMILRDISAARAGADALRQSEERLRMLLENIVDYAIFSMDLQRRITTWNGGAQRLLGWSEDEALEELGDIIFTPEDRQAGAPEAEASTALREGRAADERVHVRRDGSRFPGAGVLMLMRNPAGEAVGFVKIVRDQSAPVPLPSR